VPRDFFSLFPRKIATALRYRFWTRSLKGPADSNFLLYYPLLKQQLQFNTFDYVLLENITSLNSVKIFRRHNSKAVILYDAHNVDSQLAEEFLKKGQGERREYKIMKKKESSLHELVNGIIACSEKDLKQFEIMNGGKLKGAVIPNGVSLMKNGLDTDRESYIADHIIFCGSLDYEPNREGLSWFCKEIFPLILKQKPAARFMVVGKGDPGKELGRVLQSDFITYYGKVDDVNIFYAKAAVAIVPLLSGSGTRLKILEAMGRGVPVISTSKGAEGIGYTAGQNVLIADDKVAFAEAVLQLLSDRTLARSLVSKAYMLVKEYYDWDIIGNKLYAFIEAQ
jgi:glycosyltransferase involved in cell wall biosynthesis